MTGSITGPLWPLNNYVSSAADLAPRQVEADLKEAIVANAMNMSTCEGGKVIDRKKGEAMCRKSKIVLKAFIEERYVFPYAVPRKIR